ncbi:hypothetical protein PCL_07192 [Purpureocillium lilacinum]|uniref:Uncharacterized protein n=1 Tax=Purpureocillium lilacinum TaxID=33203 RepID=A0A2U3DSP6_PURLI|nr:hypothetical protein Purlil1_11992 [Purpureocillium lilacinum]PWI65269.1 hypothetical protein PCL_07192 [Purpureocillium lilacinum]
MTRIRYRPDWIVGRVWTRPHGQQRSASSSARPPARGSGSAGSSSSTSATAQPKDGNGVRTAEAREAALRAARMRRASEREDRDKEDAHRRQEHDDYQKRYNTAARKWVSSIIALPILLVTSYYLFDRYGAAADQGGFAVALGHAQKVMPKKPVAESLDDKKA